MNARLLAVALLLSAVAAAQGGKKEIVRAADLPVFNYSVPAKTETIIQSDEALKPFAAQVRKNIESILAQYDIKDAAKKRELLDTLAALDVLEGRDAAAAEKLAEIRALEEKPAQKLVSGLELRAILVARKDHPDRSSPEYRKAVFNALNNLLNAMPFDVVQNELRRMNAGLELASRDVLIGVARQQFDPIVQKTGSLSSEFAHALVGMRLTITDILPVRTVMVEALGSYIAANKKEKPDIWAAREVTLEKGGNYSPVNVAVWDSGVDVAIFRDQLVESGGEPAILAYDIQSRRTTGPLYPLNDEQRASLPETKKRLKGLLDLQANLDTPEASAIKKEISQLKPEQVRPFIEGLNAVGNYSHGTHVAGILLSGNPYARLVVGRLTFDYKMMPDPCPSREMSQRDAAAAQAFVDFFRRNSVRVVNMSWGGSVMDYERDLEKCGVGPSADDRKQLARELFSIAKTALENAFRSAPDILFVAAAGNSNNDASFAEFIPSSIQVPNLMTVGAVDRAGDEAPFTSYGPTVVAHANGYEVESYIPGGEKMKFSGTSMATPNVANLAAKVLAVNPALKPAEVIQIIRKNTDKTADGRRYLINPAKTVAEAKTNAVRAAR